MTVQAGANVKDVKTPVGARIGFTTARFRLSVMGNLLPRPAGGRREVEDYVIEVVDGTPPVANNDSYTVAEDGVLTINAPGVLANDTDADASPLTSTIQIQRHPMWTQWLRRQWTTGVEHERLVHLHAEFGLLWRRYVCVLCHRPTAVEQHTSDRDH